MSTSSNLASSSSYSHPDQTPTKQLKITQITQSYSLPIHIIIKIFSHLGDFEDFRRCMGLCKDIRDYIFKTPSIMKKIIVIFLDWKQEDDDNELPMLFDFQEFLMYRGRYIRNMICKFSSYNVGFRCIKMILSHTPNIESFEFFKLESNAEKLGIECPEEFRDFDDEDDDDDDDIRIPKLPKLKRLKVTHKYLNIFFGSVKNLRYLHITEAQGGPQQTKNISHFMNDQKNLKELEFSNEDYGLKKYTMFLVPAGIKFKLKSFSCDRECENFAEFCELFVNDLNEMYLYFQPNPQFLNILPNFKKLNKLRLPLRNSEDLFTSDYEGWELQSVENFHPVFDVKLSSILSRFPNVKYIQCTQLLKDSGVFETIETVDVDYFDPKILETVRLPNWKKLIINKHVLEDDWNKIVAATQNIEKKLVKGFKTADGPI